MIILEIRENVNNKSGNSQAKSLGQELTEGGLHKVVLRSRAKHDKTLIAKLIKHLPANTAGSGVSVFGSRHRNGNETPLPF